MLCGYQAVLFALFAKTFAISEGLLPEDPRLARFYRHVNLERGIAFSVVSFIVGTSLLLAAINQWRLKDFGELDYARTMRLVIPGATVFALAFQTLLSSFFVSMLGMKRR